MECYFVDDMKLRNILPSNNYFNKYYILFEFSLGFIKHLLVPQFSPREEEHRALEECVYMHFVEFLDECEGKLGVWA